MKKTVVLVILDGWGIGKKSAANPIHVAAPPNINYFKKNYLTGALQASGISVGLPWGEEGNSEVGHASIGAGKILYQHYPRISLAIKNGSFFKNKVLLAAASHAEKNNSALNLVGLLTSGNVHSSLEHLEALLKFGKEKNLKINLHLFTDGKDSPPRSAPELLKKLGVAPQSISGRYYAMDRDGHYDRTEKCYRALTGSGAPAPDPVSWIENNYQNNLNDEYISPAFFGDGAIKENDSVIFFNFREDSIRELAECFLNPGFSQFPVLNASKMFVATFTEYSKSFNAPVAFPADRVEMSLGKVLENAGKIQLRIAETEKYAHVTYFFNGLEEQNFKNEYRILIPSQNIARHDEQPEMMAKEIASRVVQAVKERGSDFILANFANPDVIAHTGNIDAAVQAIKVIDAEVRKIFDACLDEDATLIITSDHGNVEEMLDPKTGAIETKHDANPVPVYIVGKEFVSIKDDSAVARSEEEIVGILSDIAPTILEIMDIPKPEEMTGVSILKNLL